jgi:RimJ/RimL family protein N-acetyltransferase
MSEQDRTTQLPEGGQKDATCSEVAAKLRPVEPEDAHQIHGLLSSLLPDVPQPFSRWRKRWAWQYWDNPYRQNRPAGWVIATGNEILAHLGAVHVPFVAAGESRLGIIGSDYAVSNAANGRVGGFAALQLAEALFHSAGEAMVLATTANEATNAVFSRFGCRPIDWTREFWRAPATPTQEIRSHHGGTNRLIRHLMSGSLGSLTKPLIRHGGGLLARRPQIPVPAGCWLETTVPQFAVGLGHVVGRPRYGLDRTPAFLHWRYVLHPEKEKSRAFVIRDPDYRPLAAAFVSQEDLASRRVLNIENILAPVDRIDLHRGLFCAALSHAIDSEVDYVITTTGRRDLRDIFWELGFENRSRSAPALLMQISEAADTAGDRSSIDVLEQEAEFWHGAMF